MSFSRSVSINLFQAHFGCFPSLLHTLVLIPISDPHFLSKLEHQIFLWSISPLPMGHTLELPFGRVLRLASTYRCWSIKESRGGSYGASALSFMVLWLLQGEPWLSSQTCGADSDIWKWEDLCPCSWRGLFQLRAEKLNHGHRE